jgi:hypothetical protein
MENQEKNLWDVCLACINGCIRLLKDLLRLLGAMLRLTYRKVWLVGLVIIVAAACSLYYTRPSNRKHKVNAVVCINGPMLQEVKNYYEQLNNAFPESVMAEQSLTKKLQLTPEASNSIERFCTFYVIDNLDDGTADYIDWKEHNSGTDTVNVRMQDRLALQFWCKDLSQVAAIETGIMNYLNSNEQFVRAYEQIWQHKNRQHVFDSLQVEKLDTLTSRMYSQAAAKQIQSNSWDLTMGKQQITLPLAQIERFMKKKELRDSRFTQCTAPVVLQSHFVACYATVNGRTKWLVIAFILGWIAGCLIAWGWEERVQINSFLKK